jgi:hypothetical protein
MMELAETVCHKPSISQMLHIARMRIRLRGSVIEEKLPCCCD